MDLSLMETSQNFACFYNVITVITDDSVKFFVHFWCFKKAEEDKMDEGAGRIHKVYAQWGEIRSGDMQYPVSFNLTSTKLNGGQPLPSMDLTQVFPSHSQVAFTASKSPSGRLVAREMCLLAEPAPEEAPRIQVDYGVVSGLNLMSGYIDWLKYGSLRFVKESLVLKTAADAQLPMAELIQVGRTVRFKADVTGPRHRWQAIAITPISDVFTGHGRVTKVLESYGWITIPEQGEVYFPFKRFVQPSDPDKRMPSPEMLLNAQVNVQFCASLPGARGEWRAVRVQLADY